MKKISLIAVAVLSWGIFTSLFGQQYTDNKADQTLRGSGRVNPSTLGMEFDIPLGSYSGRGINVPISISYSSKVWQIEYVSSMPRQGHGCWSQHTPKYSERAAAGWTTSLAVPYIEYTGRDNIYDHNGFPSAVDAPCDGVGSPYYNNAYIHRLTVHLPSGESHELRSDDAVTIYSPFSACPPPNGNYTCDPDDAHIQSNWNRSYYAVDGSNIKYFENSDGSEYRLLMPDGSHYDFAGTLSSLYNQNVRKAITFTDRNGNQTGYNDTTKAWIDTLGRTLTAPIGTEAPTAPTVQTYTLPGMTGSYKFTWKKLVGTTAEDSALTTFSTTPIYDGDKYRSGSVYGTRPNALFGSSEDNIVFGVSVFNPVVLTEIELPTGQSYKFSYDRFGIIDRVVYPTGGAEQFSYEKIASLSYSEPGNVTDQANRGVLNRKLYPTAGQTGAFYEWLYAAEQVAPGGYKISTTNPDGTMSQRFLHQGYGSCSGCTVGNFGYDNGLAGMAYDERAFSADGILMSQKLTRWTKTSFPLTSGVILADWHPRVESEESIAYNEGGKAVSAFTKYEYAPGLNQRETPVQVSKTTQYAFTAVTSATTTGRSIDPDDEPDPNPTPVPTPTPATLVPIRITETTYLINDTVNYPSSTVRDNYRNARLLNLVTVSTVKDGAGNIVSCREMKYDESGSSPAYRGNPTTARVWDSTKGEVTNPAAYIETRAKFDVYGNQIEAIDAKNVSTLTYYDGGYSAYPVRVKTAAPDASGANGSSAEFETTATFNYQTGLPLTTTDANGQTTTMIYDSATLRLKQVVPPSGAGGSETFYHDEPNNYWVKSKTQIDVNKWAESTTYYDGLGRAYKTEQADAQGNIFVEKEFDADGRVKRVTNPFRSGETKQWTTNVYDESSRVKEVVLPDGATVKTDYGVAVAGTIGITKQITDQAGKKRKGITDALGRMIRVIEDPDGQNLATDYTFDALGNLRKTVQGEQSRYFSYDSLGRLLRAKQPEQEVNAALALPAADAITGYNSWSVGYAYDDNGNITTTTDARNISITGTYDKFNRLTKRDYSDATPDVDFYYDGTGLGAVPAFSKGKTTKVSSSVSETRYTSFDNLGRLLGSEQRTPFADTETIATAAPRTSSYQYNLAGALVSETYPSGRVVTNQFDADGALSLVQSRKNSNYGTRTYAGGIAYNTSGAVTKMQLGNGRWETAAYNNRQQVTQIGLGTTDADQNLLKLEFDYGTNTQNNGSLREQKMTVPSVGTNAGFTAVQSYAYDDLNRLQSATENVASTQTWKQAFTYDRYGNRTFDVSNNATTTLSQSNNITNPTIEAATNRFSAGQNYLYDKAGNLTQDALGKQFLYDAENHQKEVKDGSNQTVGVYLYDGEGKRVKKISATEITVFVYNGGGTLVAEYATQLSSTPQVSYLTADHLGSPRVITNENGVATKRQDYTAFGEETLTAQRTSSLGYTSALPTTNDDPRQGYTGYQKDDESGLDFAQARYYNSAHGRFTSVDPLTASANVKNPQTFNRYSYVLNSPYKFSDPLGLLPQSVTDRTKGWVVINGESVDVSRLIAENRQIPEPPPPPPPADDGTIDAADITPTVATYDRNSTESGGMLVFDSKLTDSATSVAETVEQNVVANAQNRDTALADSKAFIDSLKTNFVDDVKNAPVFPNYGTIDAKGMVNIPSSVNSGTTTASASGIVVSGSETSSYQTTDNPAVPSAAKANKQKRIINEMTSPSSQSRRNFIQNNVNTRYQFFDKQGKSLGIFKASPANLGVFYDNAVMRGQNAGNAQLKVIDAKK